MGVTFGDEAGVGLDVAQARELRSARIEALRALAALSVLAFHAWLSRTTLDHISLAERPFVAGGLGVYLFFALTGYLLYLPFARRAFGEGRDVALVRYARNRAVRILPLYVVAVVVLIALHGAGGGRWLHFLTFTANLWPRDLQDVDIALWSLAVEVRFYVLLPLIALAVAKLAGGSRTRAAVALCALAAGSAVLWWIGVHSRGGSDLRWAYSFPVTFFNFVPGMLLALVPPKPVDALRSPALLLAGGLAAWLAGGFAYWSWGQPLMALASLAILAAVVLPTRRDAPLRALDARVLALVGIASYSLYVWHVPILRFLAEHVGIGFLPLLVLGGALSLAAAGLSYALVERPFLRLRTRWGSTAAVTESGRAASRAPDLWFPSA